VAVSCEHFASFAHFDVVSFPSNPSRRRGAPAESAPTCCRSAGNSVPTEQDSYPRWLARCDRFHPKSHSWRTAARDSVRRLRSQSKLGHGLSSWIYFLNLRIWENYLRGSCGDNPSEAPHRQIASETTTSAQCRVSRRRVSQARCRLRMSRRPPTLQSTSSRSHSPTKNEW